MGSPVRGFLWGAASAGIKHKGRLDIALLAAEHPVPAAAVFTQNVVKAAPILVAMERLAPGRCQAILANSGNANACTGDKGSEDACALTGEIAQLLGVREELVVPASTGVIGTRLPLKRMRKALPLLVQQLRPDGVEDFAEAIRTTDRWIKVARASTKIGEGQVNVLGVAKGAGMIGPFMATTLCFVVTDAVASAAELRRALRTATTETFNAIDVDGDASTNDIIVLLASGAAGSGPRASDQRSQATFEKLVRGVLGKLAREVVRDGEGATKLVHLEVSGLRDEADARKVARSIARSMLVKTALFGEDPNWGRILVAAGHCGVRFDPREAEISICGHVVARGGGPTGIAAERKAKKAMKRAELEIHVRLGEGDGRATHAMCDLGTAYVKLNAAYRT